MAVIPRDIPIDRAQVQTWISQYQALKSPKGSLEDFIRQAVSRLNLDDEYVDTRGHDNLPDQFHIVDMILRDLPSYVR